MAERESVFPGEGSRTTTTINENEKDQEILLLRNQQSILEDAFSDFASKVSKIFPNWNTNQQLNGILNKNEPEPQVKNDPGNQDSHDQIESGLEIKKLQAEILNLKTALSNEEKFRRQIEREIEHYQQQVGALENQNLALKKKLKDAENEKYALQHQLKSLEATFALEKDKVNEPSSGELALLKENLELKKSITMLLGQMEIMKNKSELLIEPKSDSHEAQITGLKEKIENLSIELELNQCKIAELERNAEFEKLKNQDQMLQADEMRMLVIKYKEEMKLLEMAMQKLVQENKLLKDELNCLNSCA